MQHESTCRTCGAIFHIDAWAARNGRGHYCSRTCYSNRASVPLAERFWNKVQKTESCWLWLGSSNRRGYGAIDVDGVLLRSHRVSWELANGPIPDGLYVLHRCDNPSCVNPEHLFIGTQKENMQDCSRKGRKAGLAGNENPAAKLTAEDVHNIRKLHATGVGGNQIAKMYPQVSLSAIFRIIARRSWQSVA